MATKKSGLKRVCSTPNCNLPQLSEITEEGDDGKKLTPRMVCRKHWYEHYARKQPWTLGRLVGDALRAVSVNGQPVVS